jgi:anion-transporting  ArsA/GET3 family ATPase
MASILELLQKQKLLICVGAGGVGKTSMAATLGLQGALMGRNVLVLTIDPAKRLANSLGLQEFGNDEVQIDIENLRKKINESIELEEYIEEQKVDTEPNKKSKIGSLWAMMLDGQHTFDNLIEKLATSEEQKQAILNNNIYKGITDSIVGNQEYMATEKLYDVITSGRYDLVVLDTPPVKNALDFLDSPGRMAKFVDKKIMQWFLTPYEEKQTKGPRSLFRRLVSGTSAALFKLLSHIFGKDFLEDIAIFFQHFRDLYEGFQQRHQAVEEMFLATSTSFLIVTAPHEPSVEVAEFFMRELKNRRMNNAGIIFNQRHMIKKDVQTDSIALKCEELAQDKNLPKHISNQLMARISLAHRRLYNLSLYEEELYKRLSTKSPKMWSVPRIPKEVHDINALYRVGKYLLQA